MTEHDEDLGIAIPYVRGTARPDQILVETESTLGVEASAELLEAEFVQLRGTPLLVRRRQAVIAFGGGLHFDLVFIIDCDGRTNTLSEVRFRRRPDTQLSVSTTALRAVRLQPLYERALRKRTAYRRVSDTAVAIIRTDAERDSYVKATRQAQGARWHRTPDEELQQVADAYRRALGVEFPTAAVQRELRYRNKDTAKKRVRQARERGFLEPPPGDRRGGIL